MHSDFVESVELCEMFRGFTEKSRACLHAFCMSQETGIYLYGLLTEENRMQVRKFFFKRMFCNYGFRVLEAMQGVDDPHDMRDLDYTQGVFE